MLLIPVIIARQSYHTLSFVSRGKMKLISLNFKNIRRIHIDGIHVARVYYRFKRNIENCWFSRYFTAVKSFVDTKIEALNIKIENTTIIELSPIN